MGGKSIVPAIAGTVCFSATEQGTLLCSLARTAQRCEVKDLGSQLKKLRYWNEVHEIQ